MEMILWGKQRLRLCYNSLLILRYALGIIQNYLFDTALSGRSTDLSELIKV